MVSVYKIFHIFSNDFEEYGSISFLFICPKLENLVLQGNPISYESEYRATIFRILPGLKNLDVIMMKRVAKSVCKKDKSPTEDDEFDGNSSNSITTSNIPKELEGKKTWIVIPSLSKLDHKWGSLFSKPC